MAAVMQEPSRKMRDLRRAVTLSVDPAFDFGGAPYRNLFERASCGAFQHPDWLSAFYGTLAGPKDFAPLVVTGRDSAGDLLLVVPLIRRRADRSTMVEYAFLGVTDYARPIAAPELTLDAELSAEFHRALGAYDLLRIEPVRGDAVALWRDLLGLSAEPLGFSAHAAPYEVWRAGVPGRRRGVDLARKSRRLVERGALRLQVADGAAAAEAIHIAARLRQERFADDPLQDAAFRDFYTAVAMRGAESGLARTYLLTCGAELVAMLFGLIDGPRFCYLLLACDYANFGRFSPGMIMFDQVMRDWFDSGGQVFDFTIGDEPFKSGLGAEPMPMYRFTRGGVS